jgi:GntR family transcriptional regulator
MIKIKIDKPITKMDAGFQSLDRNSEIPLHSQLRQILLNKIERGEWAEGQLISREVDLMQEYGLSRYTVRQTLEALTQAGYLIRTKGRGTVVNLPKVEQDLSRFYSFARDMSAKGLEPTSRVLSLEEVMPDQETAQLLTLEGKGKVYHLRRLRLAGGEPLILESSYLSFSKTVELARHDWQILPLYNVLDYYYGIKVERAEEFLEPVILAPEEAELLGVAPGNPAFRVERHTYDSEGRLFERRVSLVRGDRYRFHVELPKVDLAS